jgi:type IV secretion system protein VirB10
VNTTAKVVPERLALRAGPRPVTRINRRVLMVASGIGTLLLFGAGAIALHPPRAQDRDQIQELYNTHNKPTPDGLASLPRSYAEIPAKGPLLGPPLPGDLGGPVHKLEKDMNVATAEPGAGFQADPEENAARAERIRQSRQDIQATESGVFFQTARAHGQTTPVSSSASESLAALKAQVSSLGSRNGAATAFDRLPPSPFGFSHSDDDQNGQDHKQAFLAGGVDKDVYNPHALQDPVSPYQLMAGTIIPASLITGLNSDLPGLVIAQVTENVYDTTTGAELLIPQGARLIGAYDSAVTYGQKRALVAWRRIIMPDGSSIVIDNLPATDAAGYAGLSDRVDEHWGRLLAGVGLATLLGVGTELSFGHSEDELAKSVRQSLQGNVSKAGEHLVDRNLNIQPTITIRPGSPVRVIVAKDLILRPYGETE